MLRTSRVASQDKNQFRPLPWAMAIYDGKLESDLNINVCAATNVIGESLNRYIGSEQQH